MNVLVIDIGGTNVKILATGQKEPMKFPSGPVMTAKAMVILKPIALHLCFQLQQRMRTSQPSNSCLKRAAWWAARSHVCYAIP
jgi:hypothetical protein